jgi:DNA polymerase III subunit gamma/tau
MPKTPREAARVAISSSQGTLALYRKYRPSTFGELVGQVPVVAGLEAALSANRLTHAYLFSGPRGTGKTSAARILAKCLCCQVNGISPNPCGHCEACVSIAEGTSFDVVEIDAASNRRIDEIRELRERVKFAPVQFRKKVYIVDEVHMLTPEAFNALLKTLEEPPEWVIFILATTEAQRVPATILSRCQRYEFRRVAPADIAGRLSDVAKREKIQVTKDALTRIAYLADGALRDALVLLEQARGYSDGGAIDQEVLDKAFGSTHRMAIERIATAVGDDDPAAALLAVADAIAGGIDPAWLGKGCLRWFRLALVSLVSRELLESEVPADEARPIAELAAVLGRAKVLTALRHLAEIDYVQRFSTQPRIDLELALMRVILPSDDLTMRALSDRLRTLEERAPISRGPSAAPAAPAAAPSNGSDSARKTATKSSKRAAGEDAHHADPPSADPLAGPKSINAAQLAGLWPMILSAAKDRSVQAFAHLQHASIAEAAGDTVTIAVDDKYNRDRLAEDPMALLVADAIAQASGTRPKLRFELAASPKPASTRGQRAGLALAADVLGEELI